MSDIFAVAARAGGPLGNSMEWYDKATGAVVFQINPLGGGGQLVSKTTITAAQMLALSGTPVTLLAAPGAGLLIQIFSVIAYVNFNTTAYAAGSVLQVLENSIAVATTTAALINTTTAIAIQMALPLLGTTASLGAANSAVTLGVAGSNFTTGNSPVDIILSYTIVTL